MHSTGYKPCQPVPFGANHAVLIRGAVEEMQLQCRTGLVTKPVLLYGEITESTPRHSDVL